MLSIVNYFKKIYKQYKKIKSLKRKKRKQKIMQLMGREICTKISQAFEKEEIKYFYFYGTMLGFVREKKIIQHDNDIDVCVINEENFSWSKLEKILTENSFKKEKEFRLEGEITEQTYRYKRVSIDFFLCNEKNNNMSVYAYFQDPNIEYEYKNHYSVTEDIFSKIEEIIEIDTELGKMKIPKNYEKLLIELYGENWRIPNANYNYLEESPATKILKDKIGVYEEWKV